MSVLLKSLTTEFNIKRPVKLEIEVKLLDPLEKEIDTLNSHLSHACATQALDGLYKIKLEKNWDELNHIATITFEEIDDSSKEQIKIYASLGIKLFGRFELAGKDFSSFSFTLHSQSADWGTSRTSKSEETLQNVSSWIARMIKKHMNEKDRSGLEGYFRYYAENERGFDI